MRKKQAKCSDMRASAGHVTHNTGADLQITVLKGYRMPLTISIHVDLNDVLAFLSSCANGNVSNTHVASNVGRGCMYTSF